MLLDGSSSVNLVWKARIKTILNCSQVYCDRMHVELQNRLDVDSLLIIW